MNRTFAAYLALLIVAPALLVPAHSSFADSETFSMLLHDDVADTLNSESSEQPYQKPPLADNTENGLYRVEITWDPVEIKPNKIVSFDIKIIDLLTNEPAENVHYDFAVVKDDQPIKELKGSLALDGIATHTVEFPSSGSFRVLVNVLGSGDVLNQGVEFATFELKVVPEFPAGTIIVMVTLVGITIALTRFTVLNKKTASPDTSL